MSVMNRLSRGICCPESLHPGDLLRLMQDIAAEDADRRGAGRDALLEQGCVWVLIKNRLEIKRWPKAGERVTLTTWPMQGRRLFYPRAFELCDASGALMIEVLSLWAIIDVESRAMITLESRGITMEDVEEETFSPPPRLRIPPGGDLCDLTPKPEQIDAHMNNAAYLDAAESMLPESFAERELCAIAVDYEHELLPGWHAQVRIVPEEDSCSFEGCMEDKVCFRIKLGFR